MSTCNSIYYRRNRSILKYVKRVAIPEGALCKLCGVELARVRHHWVDLEGVHVVQACYVCNSLLKRDISIACQYIKELRAQTGKTTVLVDGHREEITMPPYEVQRQYIAYTIQEVEIHFTCPDCKRDVVRHLKRYRALRYYSWYKLKELGPTSYRLLNDGEIRLKCSICCLQDYDLFTEEILNSYKGRNKAKMVTIRKESRESLVEQLVKCKEVANGRRI